MALNRNLTGIGWLVDLIVPPPDILGDQAPVPEARLAAAGAGVKASRNDHQHPRLTSSTRVTLGGDGTATVTYTRSFSSKPAISLTAINPSGRQVMLEVVNDIQVGADYTGCVIKGSRAQLLPALTSIVLIGPLISALQNFDVLGGSASGVEVSVIAIQPSTT